MKPKSLAEFIEKFKEATDNQKAEFIIKLTSQHLLEVAKEWCAMDAYEQGYDKVTDEHSCDDSRGRNCSADELYDFLENHINAKKGEKKDG